DSKTLKNLVNQFAISEPTVILLFAPGLKSQVILRTFSTPLKAPHYISSLVESMGGKGGGSGDAYTGGFADVDDPMQLYDDLVASIRNSLS
ncbi:MAG: hypothetical protein ACFFEE_12175, partial [Candidatus Thorarchaeota archaeon]